MGAPAWLLERYQSDALRGVALTIGLIRRVVESQKIARLYLRHGFRIYNRILFQPEGKNGSRFRTRRSRFRSNCELRFVMLTLALNPSLQNRGFGLVEIGEDGTILVDAATVARSLERHSPASAPGRRLLKLLEFLYSRRTFERVLLPTIRDMQREHAEDRSKGLIWRSRWRLVPGYWSVGRAVTKQLPFSGVLSLIKSLKLIVDLLRAIVEMLWR